MKAARKVTGWTSFLVSGQSSPSFLLVNRVLNTSAPSLQLVVALQLQRLSRMSPGGPFWLEHLSLNLNLKSRLATSLQPHCSFATAKLSSDLPSVFRYSSLSSHSSSRPSVAERPQMLTTPNRFSLQKFLTASFRSSHTLHPASFSFPKFPLISSPANMSNESFLILMAT